MRLSSERNRRGFTIVEILIVIVIISVLASIVVVAFQGIQQRARNTARVQTANAIIKNGLAYQAIYGKGPLYGMLLGTGFDSQCIGSDFEDVAPDASYSCRYVVPDVGSPSSSAINQPLYDALRSVSQYSMNYSPVTQNSFSGITRVVSSAPFITRVHYDDTAMRYTLDGGPLLDYYVLLSYRLEGVDQNCQLPVVRIASQTATQRNFTSGSPYSVTNGGATECWFWLDW